MLFDRRSVVGLAFVLCLWVGGPGESFAAEQRALLGSMISRDASGQCVSTASPRDLLAGVDDSTLERIANPVLATRADVEARACECTAIERILSPYVESSILIAVLFAQEEKGDLDRGILHRIALANQLVTLCRQFWLVAVPARDEGFYIAGENLALLMPPTVPVSARKPLFDISQRVLERIRAQWRALGLQAPQGLVFVKVLGSRDDLQGLIPGEDAKGVAGLTLPCRFVALSREGDLEQFELTLHHELAHAFMNSTTGFSGSHSLPRWFEEGFAEFIAEDPGRKVLTVRREVQPDGTVSVVRSVAQTVDEYLEYKSRFDFIQARYTESGVARFVGSALSKGDVRQALTTQLGFINEQAFFASASEWAKNKKTWTIWLTVGLLVWAVMVIVAFGTGGRVLGVLCLLIGPGATWWASQSEYLRDTNLVKYSAIAGAVGIVLAVVTAIPGIRGIGRKRLIRGLIDEAEQSVDRVATLPNIGDEPVARLRKRLDYAWDHLKKGELDAATFHARTVLEETRDPDRLAREHVEEMRRRAAPPFVAFVPPHREPEFLVPIEDPAVLLLVRQIEMLRAQGKEEEALELLRSIVETMNGGE